jgi:excisionase family DNA binding protein
MFAYILIDRRKKMPLKVSGLKLYSVDEVATMLKSTKPTIRLYFRKGKIKGQKVTGRWYITEENLKKYLSGDYPVLNK